MIKAVFIDFDNTLYSHVSKSIPSSAIEAMNKLQANDIKVFLCTGRTKYELAWYDFKGFKFDGYVFNNSQLILDKDNKVIHEQAIGGKLKDIILDLFNNKTLPVYLTTAKGLYINYVNELVNIAQASIDSPVPELGEYANENIYMASVIINNEDDLDKYDIRNNSEIIRFHEHAVDVCQKGVSKAIGVKIMLEHCGISLEDTMAIGDGRNDIEMLKECKIGVCVGASSEEIKNISDYVSTDIDDDGILNACKHYKLID